ncbi:MAG: glycosyl transferase [Chloroflexi bacterium]|nr:glycosyl transferase [Chloroflexota bacterium]
MIRAKNEARDIGETLATVFRQKGVGTFEVIVVDSGSTDGTLDIARSFPVRVVQIPPERFTYGRALNVGIAEATGDIVVSLSAHSLPASDEWLKQILAPFRDPSIGGVYGRHMPRRNVGTLELFGMHLSGVASSKPRRQERDMMFSNANGAFRRALVVEHPFDETLPGAEDLAWADWIERQGWAVYYEPRAAVFHSHGESLWRLLRRMVKDQPTIWGLKLGVLAHRPAADQSAAPAYRR